MPSSSLVVDEYGRARFILDSGHVINISHRGDRIEVNAEDGHLLVAPRAANEVTIQSVRR